MNKHAVTDTVIRSRNTLISALNELTLMDKELAAKMFHESLEAIEKHFKGTKPTLEN